MPWIIRIEKGIMKDLLLEEEQDTYFPKFKLEGLMRGDYQSRMNAYAIGVGNGFFSPNDVRRLENMDLIPHDLGGDDFYLNGSYNKLQNAGAAYGLNQPENGDNTSKIKNDGGDIFMQKFWNWIHDDSGGRVLRLEGPIDSESYWGSEITPQDFRNELYAEDGDVTIYLNSPGGNVFAAAEIYTMIRDYPHNVRVRIASIAASAATVIAMAGDVVQMSPTALLMVHDPSTIAMGNAKDMEKAITTLNEVKESIINAYAAKTGLSRSKISKLMSDETWMNAKKAVELGFADEILFDEKKPEQPKPEKEEDEPDEDKPDDPDKDNPDEEGGEDDPDEEGKSPKRSRSSWILTGLTAPVSWDRPFWEKSQRQLNPKVKTTLPMTK